eukprot:Platyproteum_vivax@DN3663_c0_g1_i1.p1
MPNSFGRKARTRDKFSKGFRKKGMPSVGEYLRVFKRGEFVDIIVDPSVHRGQPYHFYHGRTGKIFDVTAHAVGVEIKKVVRGKELLKRLHVRIEHVRKSRTREDFLIRLKRNAEIRKHAKENGLPKPDVRRLPDAPKAAFMLPPQTVHVLEPLPFVEDY